MKKILLLLFIILSSSLFAQTATLNLQGNVPAILEVSVIPTPEASNLDLSKDIANLRIATVIERSNKKLGYTLSVSSNNAVTNGNPVFINDDTSVISNIPYDLNYNGSTISFINGAAIISDSTEKNSGVNNDLFISYNGASIFAYEGSYSDTLTFIISAK